MSINLELKARVSSLEALVSVARSCGAEFQGILIQEDTYFAVPHGRLKLREREGATAELLYYEREETRNERWSSYESFPVQDPRLLKAMLTDALGIKTIVRKERQLYIHRGARIHLDQVQSLGSFIEFEVPAANRDEAVATMKDLRSKFGIEDAQVFRGSYSDLILGKRISGES